ncbi:unnamed protein product [Haemonchus placei]|uniref:Uncharacterized protein n=1 Tax=Haemonchus placei TaxID=6290 RepID=A0A0N4X7R8_HAEPC|nr:unnamed protein product [Haemonchus placei]
MESKNGKKFKTPMAERMYGQLYKEGKQSRLAAAFLSDGDDEDPTPQSTVGPIKVMKISSSPPSDTETDNSDESKSTVPSSQSEQSSSVAAQQIQPVQLPATAAQQIQSAQLPATSNSEYSSETWRWSDTVKTGYF